jgi:hypothetical protein
MQEREIEIEKEREREREREKERGSAENNWTCHPNWRKITSASNSSSFS